MQPANQLNWQVIVNPHAGCGKGERDKNKIVKLLDNAGLTCQIWTSEYPGHTIIISRELAQKGEKNFIIAGGDGSLNEAVNGIFSANQENNDKIVLGVIPVGTGNDWIKTFGIPNDYEKAIDTIKLGKTLFQDVGEITSHNNPDEKRYFINIVGFGFDALVAGKANVLKNRGISGLRVYLQSFISSYLNFRTEPAVFYIDDEKFRVDLFSASVGIGKFNGGGFMQVPDANPVKGIFHITIIRKMSALGILKNFSGLYDGSFIKDHRVSTYSGKLIRLRSKKPLLYEADGESLGKGSCTIRIIPHRLQVIHGDTLLF
jgi:YegS/Rv2252/BmrU family lipid kinase